MKHKTFVVVNPRSGRAKIKNRLLEVVQELSLAGHSVTVYPTKFRGDATDAVALLDDSFDTVVCCGGDGTLNEVITGLMNNKNHYNLECRRVPKYRFRARGFELLQGPVQIPYLTYQ